MTTDTKKLIELAERAKNVSRLEALGLSTRVMPLTFDGFDYVPNPFFGMGANAFFRRIRCEIIRKA